MDTRKPILKTLLIMGLALVVATGCEDHRDDGSSDTPTHDFGDNDSSVIVAMGDSITRGYGLEAAESYPAQLSVLTGKTVINAGVDGAHSDVGVGAVSGYLSSRKPGYLLVLYGVNDIIHGVSRATIIKNLRTIVQAAKANSTVPILGTLTPVYGVHAHLSDAITDLNTQIMAMATEEVVTVANLNAALAEDSSLFQVDGLHPTAAGEALIAKAFYKHVTGN